MKNDDLHLFDEAYVAGLKHQAVKRLVAMAPEDGPELLAAEKSLLSEDPAEQKLAQYVLGGDPLANSSMPLGMQPRLPDSFSERGDIWQRVADVHNLFDLDVAAAQKRAISELVSLNPAEGPKWLAAEKALASKNRTEREAALQMLSETFSTLHLQSASSIEPPKPSVLERGR